MPGCQLDTRQCLWCVVHINMPPCNQHSIGLLAFRASVHSRVLPARASRVCCVFCCVIFAALKGFVLAGAQAEPPIVQLANFSSKAVVCNEHCDWAQRRWLGASNLSVCPGDFNESSVNAYDCFAVTCQPPVPCQPLGSPRQPLRSPLSALVSRLTAPSEPIVRCLPWQPELGCHLQARWLSLVWFCSSRSSAGCMG